MASTITTRLFALLTAVLLWVTGVGQWLLARACELATRLGQLVHRLAAFLGGIALSIKAAFVSVFQGVGNVLKAIFSWETLFWFMAAFGMICWAVWQNRPEELSRWFDRLDLSSISSPVVVILIAPVLLVLIALGRMKGVRWHTRQMAVVGTIVLVGGVFLTARWVRESAAVTAPVAVDHTAPALRVASDNRPVFEQELPISDAAPAIQVNEAVAVNLTDPMEGGSVQILMPLAEDEPPSPLVGDEVVIAPSEAAIVEDGGDISTSFVEPPGSVQILETEVTAAAAPATGDSTLGNTTSELETVQIQILRGTDELIDVSDVPEWVDAARQASARRTICADTQWPSQVLAVWDDDTERLQSSSESILCGDVVTLDDRPAEADIVISVSHVGSLEEGERFVEFATERIVRDRIHRLYPVTQSWSRGGSATRISHAGMVSERCIETAMLHVGEFEEPVYTFHARVRLHEADEALLINQMQDAEQHERLVMGGIGLGSIAWLFVIIATCLRINLATDGRHRALLILGGIACLAAPMLVVMFV